MTVRSAILLKERRDECIYQERNAIVEQVLTQSKIDRKQAQVLDLGCGNGRVLKHLLDIGFESQNLCGIDLKPDRIATARRELPAEVQLFCGNAMQPEFESQKADLVLAFTVFSSVLDANDRQQLAARMWSLRKPGGAILLYDFVVNNPANRNVRKVTPKEIHGLFPQAHVELRRLTLAPPLARGLPAFYRALASIPFLRTHMLCWLTEGRLAA